MQQTECPGVHRCDTWADVYEYLGTCTPEQLAQPAQLIVTQPDGDKIEEVQPIFCIGTIEALEFEKTRSSFDNKHHPESVVILADSNMFAEDGLFAENIITGEKLYIE